ncbi:MAG: hypothetical protein SGILL_001867 [Bacillariaceae sp.]
MMGSWFDTKRSDMNNIFCTTPNMNMTLMNEENARRFQKSMQCNQLQGSLKTTHFKIAQCTPQMPTRTHMRALQTKKRVSFRNQHQVIEIPSIRELSPVEFKALYMSKEEMGKIHEECWRLVDLMNSGIEYEDQPGFSKRGLVDLKDDSVERRRRMRDQAYKIVFGVQKFHSTNNRRPAARVDCLDVTDIIANLYHKAAARAQEEAYDAAWFDSVAARMQN